MKNKTNITELTPCQTDRQANPPYGAPFASLQAGSGSHELAEGRGESTNKKNRNENIKRNNHTHPLSDRQAGKPIFDVLFPSLHVERGDVRQRTWGESRINR